MIALIQAIINSINNVSGFQQDLVHTNYVTYAWLFVAVGGAVVFITTIVIAVAINYAAKKVNKETCETIHEGLCKDLVGLKDCISDLVEKSGKNHDTLIKIKTMLEFKEKNNEKN